MDKFCDMLLPTMKESVVQTTYILYRITNSKNKNAVLGCDLMFNVLSNLGWWRKTSLLVCKSKNKWLKWDSQSHLHLILWFLSAGKHLEQSRIFITVLCWKTLGITANVVEHIYLCQKYWMVITASKKSCREWWWWMLRVRFTVDYLLDLLNIWGVKNHNQPFARKNCWYCLK